MNDEIFTPAPTQGHTFTKSGVKAAIVRTASMSAAALAGYTTWRFFGTKPGSDAPAAHSAAPQGQHTAATQAHHETTAAEPAEKPMAATTEESAANAPRNPATDAVAPDEPLTTGDPTTVETGMGMEASPIEEASPEEMGLDEDQPEAAATADAPTGDIDTDLADIDLAEADDEDNALAELDTEIEMGEEAAAWQDAPTHDGLQSASTPGESDNLETRSFAHPSPVSAPAAASQLPGVERIDYSEVDAHSWIEEHNLTALGFQKLEIRGNVCPVAYFSDANGHRIFMADTDGDGIFDAAYNSDYRLIDTFTSEDDVSLGFMADDIAALIVEQNGADYIPPAGLIDDMMSDFPDDTYASTHTFSSNDLQMGSAPAEEAANDDYRDDGDNDNDGEGYDNDDEGYDSDNDDYFASNNDGRGSDSDGYSDEDGNDEDDSDEDDSDSVDEDSDLWELEF
ncbi:MAG: hypothetical protein IJT30_06685 [Muribaculaceae bacterium]|nr:hypothetical protein [Muribaculaceae bacterium]